MPNKRNIFYLPAAKKGGKKFVSRGGERHPPRPALIESRRKRPGSPIPKGGKKGQLKGRKRKRTPPKKKRENSLVRLRPRIVIGRKREME